MVCKYFLPFHELSFHFVDTVIFDAQKFLIFIWLILSIFFHCLCFFVLKKSLSNSMSWSISQMCFSESFFIYFFFLGYSCFTVLCWFLLYNKMNQLYIYRYLLPLGPPHTHPHPAPLGHHSTKLHSLCYIAASHWLSVLHMGVYILICSNYVSIPTLQIGSSVPFF